MLISSYSLPQLIAGSSVAVLGYFVLSRGPKNRIHQAFAAFSGFTAMWLLTAGIVYSLANSHKVAAFFLMRISYTGVIFILPPFLYLTRLLAGSQTRYLDLWTRTSFLVASIFVATVWRTNWFIQDLNLYHFGYYPNVGWIHPIFLAWVAVGMALIHQALFVALRGKEKLSYQWKQIRYVWVAFIAFTPVIIDFLPNYGIDVYPLGCVFVLFFFVVTSYAIVKHQLLDIAVIIRKTAVYSILAALITATYLVVVLIMEKWFQGFFGYRSLVTNVVVGFAIALGFNPLRDVVQHLVDRWFFTKSTPALAEENERLRHEVTQSDRMKAVATLAAGMAHEIKNPLTSIKTFAEYLPQKYDDPQFRDRFAKIMTQEVDKMNALIHRLLEFARPAEPQLKPVSLKYIIEEILELLHGTLLKNQIQTQTIFDPTDTIYADQGQLKQALLNVILNSIEAMPGPGRIAVSTMRQNGSIAIMVTDTGPGIAKKDLQHIFDPFYTTKAGGTGLGLSVVHSIVRQHGGRLAAESELGKGTTIRMTLPVQQGGQHGAAAHSHCR